VDVVLTVFVGSIVLLGAYFIGQLVYMLIRTHGAVRTASAAAHLQARQEIDGLSTEDLRARLLGNAYLSTTLRHDADVQSFLARVAAHDEIALAQSYPQRKLYSMLAKAEIPLRIPGRPEAVDEVREIDLVLQELAKRSR
jgi:hypothetical protein